MNGNNQPTTSSSFQDALAAENVRLRESIAKALVLLNVPAISSVQSLMGRQASADLSRAVRLLNATLPAGQSERPPNAYTPPGTWPLPNELQHSPTRTEKVV